LGFFNSVIDELEMGRHGIDVWRYQRFEEYIQHIPREHNADERPSYALNRPWTRDDAEFCYAFVSRTLLQWQATNLGPIHREPSEETSDESTVVETFAGLRIPEGAWMHRFESSLSEPEIEVLVLGEDEKTELESLALEREYEYVARESCADVPIKLYSHRFELMKRSVRLLTHRPAKWEILLSVRIIALSARVVEYVDGMPNKENLSINTASADEIRGFAPDLLGELGEAIVATREQHGLFRSRADVERIPGITPLLVGFICRTFHARESSQVVETSDLN
jgi:hypothetical protein